jgi:hypothetical protein
MSRASIPPSLPGLVAKEALLLSAKGPPVPETRGVTVRFIDAAARAASVPAMLGQLGLQLDNGTLWRSVGMDAGDWASVAVSTGASPFVVGPLSIDNGTILTTGDIGLQFGSSSTRIFSIGMDGSLTAGRTAIMRFGDGANQLETSNGGPMIFKGHNGFEWYTFFGYNLVAKLDYNSTFTVGKVRTLTASKPYAATITPNADVHQKLKVAPLTGAVTFDTPTGTLYDGDRLELVWSQDAVGGRAVGFSTGYLFPPSVPASLITLTASKFCYATFEYNADLGKMVCMRIIPDVG